MISMSLRIPSFVKISNNVDHSCVYNALTAQKFLSNLEMNSF